MVPLVSILVPVYNVETYIERCARSIFGQTYNAVEFVFVDDGCTDSSIAVLNRVIDEYPRLKQHIYIIRHPQNRGLAAARNTAVDACHGDFVIHVDSDDWIELDAIELLVKKQQETDADMVYTKGYYKHTQTTQWLNNDGWSTNKETTLANLLQYRASIGICSKLIRRTLYIKHGIRCNERGSYFEDFQILSQLIYYLQTLACIDESVYHYNRLNTGSICSNLSTNIEIQRQGIVSIQAVIDFFRDKEHHYYMMAQQFYVRYLRMRLYDNCRHWNKDGYKEFLTLLEQTDRSHRTVIGWDKPWNRAVDRSIYIKMLALVISYARYIATSFVKRIRRC